MREDYVHNKNIPIIKHTLKAITNSSISYKNNRLNNSIIDEEDESVDSLCGDGSWKSKTGSD